MNILWAFQLPAKDFLYKLSPGRVVCLYLHNGDDDITVVSRRSELNRSSQVAAALRKASCRRISCSTSSTLPPSSLLLMNGSWAVSHASATTASWANWWTSNTERRRKGKMQNFYFTFFRWTLYVYFYFLRVCTSVFIKDWMPLCVCGCVCLHCCRTSQCLSHFSNSSCCLATTLSSFSLIWQSKSASQESESNVTRNYSCINLEYGLSF